MPDIDGLERRYCDGEGSDPDCPCNNHEASQDEASGVFCQATERCPGMPNYQLHSGEWVCLGCLGNYYEALRNGIGDVPFIGGRHASD